MGSMGKFIPMLALLMLASCAKQLSIEEQYQPYVTKFESLWGNSVDNLVIKSGTLETNAGVCHKEFGATPTITIDSNRWNEMTDLERQDVVFHELGHCVLGRVHNDDMYAEQVETRCLGQSSGGTHCYHECPKSLMYSKGVQSLCVEQNYDAYVRELFQRD